jgi:hypothetical protein
LRISAASAAIASRSRACRPSRRTVDANATLVAVGRFEVWQRIREFLTINDADLARLQDREEGES